MREAKLIYDGSPCDVNFYSDGPKTVEEAVSLEESYCPYLKNCKKDGFLHGVTGHECVMRIGIQVAQKVLDKSCTVVEEMKNFRKANIHPAKGWIWSPDRKDFSIVTDNEEAIKLIEEFAHIVLDDKNPTVPQTDDPRLKVGSSYGDEERFGYNGGQPCDVSHGPCSCGAYH